MSLLRRRELGIEPLDTPDPNVPNDDRARLMYYLDCVCQLVPQLRSDPELHALNALTRYHNYRNLDGDDINRLIISAYLLSPDELDGKVLFLIDELCGDSDNKFYNISQVTHIIGVAGPVLVGGQNREVVKIMACKMEWITRYWKNPISNLVGKFIVLSRNASLTLLS